MPANQPTIVIVDDDETKHLLYRTAFEQCGFAVTVLRDADGDFLEWMAQHKPSIISMDILIGSEDGHQVERDGFEAMRLLKSDARTKDIPIIVLSNFTSEDRVLKAKELGATDYIIPQSFTIQQIPEHFLHCLRDGGNYQPWHPLFRAG